MLCPSCRCERFWSLCAPTADKLESGGVVVTVMTAMKAAGKFSQTETGE
jgi:hypothetical protein